MSNIARNYYRMAFDKSFVTKYADEFESFFCDLMFQVYGPDFEPKPAWGRQGDSKCDGLLKTKRFLFACHAPKSLKVSEAKKKISSDFDGAKAQWKDKFDTWVYVNNQRQGLPKDLQDHIDAMDASESNLKVTQWGFQELLREFSMMDIKKCELLFGISLSTADMVDINYGDVQNLLSVISHTSEPQTPIVKPVRADKLAANGLSEYVKKFLVFGMAGASTVKMYIDAHHDAEYGDRLAAAFKSEYDRISAIESDPDTIFVMLQNYLHIHERSSPAYQAAGFAVLAHFFETCDIYRDPMLVIQNDPAN